MTDTTSKTNTFVQAALVDLDSRYRLGAVDRTTTGYALTANDFVKGDCTSGAQTHTLPTAPPDGTRVGGKKMDATANTLTFNCGGSDKVNTSSGGTSIVMSLLNQAFVAQYHAADSVWLVTNTDLPLSGLDARYFGATQWAARQVGNHAIPAARTYWANKANTTTMPTTEDTGQPITITSGTSSTPAINSGLLVTSGGTGGGADIYYQFNPSSPVTRIGARFVLGHVMGTTQGGVVCLGMANEVTNTTTLASGLTISPHLFVSPTNWVLGTFTGGSGLVVHKSGNWATPLNIDNTVYEMEMWIVGTTVTLALPDGSIITDTNAAYAAGVYGFVEPFAATLATDNIVGITEHWWDTGTQIPPTGQFILRDQVGQVAASRLARPGTNMVYSPNFENEAAWAGQTAAGFGTVSTDQAYNGLSSWKFTSNNTAQFLNLLCDTYGNTVRPDATAGRIYRFECQLRAKSGNVGTGTLGLAIEALDGSLGHVSYPLLTVISPPSTGLSTSAWTKFVGYTTAMPSNAAYMAALFFSNTTPNGDVFYIDGVVIEDVTEVVSPDTSIVPATNNAYNLGSSSSYWNTAYIVSANMFTLNMIGSTYGATVAANNAATANQALTLPATTTDTIVARTSTDILTHKDLTDASNTFPAATAMLSGWDYLGSFTFGSALTTTGDITIAARARLLILINIVGMGGSDIPVLHFNSDTGNNYETRYMSVAAGGTTWTNTETATSSKLRLSSVSASTARVMAVDVMNIASVAKTVTPRGIYYTGSTSSHPSLELGGGVWANTSAQITKVELVSASANTFSTGTEIIILGRN